MEFLVEFEVNVPDAASATEVDARESAEASAAAKLVDEGHLMRVWKPPAAPGGTKALGLYRADSEAELAGLLSALPLYDWMQVTVTPLAPHPNDPASPEARHQPNATTSTQEVNMSTTGVNSETTQPREAGGVDMRLEIDIIPVSDIDRAKEFYERLGWRFDDDVAPLEGLRIVQFTPPGSGCAITFGMGLTTAAPGSAEAGLVVSDIEAAHDEIVGRGIDASDVWHGPPFPVEARQPGPDPERTSYGSFFSFADPDGNLWIAQEVTTRLPGRIDAAGTAFASTADLASALQRAEAAHREHEKRNGHRLKQGLAERVRDEDWPAWYASYVAAEQAGTDLPK